MGFQSKHIINDDVVYPDNKKAYEHIIVTGGTFDKIHKGHKALLDKAIELAKLYNGLLVITVTEDGLYKSHSIRKYKDRVNDIRQYIMKVPYHPLFTFYELGYPSYSKELWKVFKTDTPITLVCSEESYNGALQANRNLKENGLNPMTIVVVPLVYAQNGQRISSSRIHNKEIDLNGNSIDTECS